MNFLITVGAAAEFALVASWAGYMYNEARADSMLHSRQKLLQDGWHHEKDRQHIEREIELIEHWQSGLTYQKCFSGPRHVPRKFNAHYYS